MKNRVYGVVGIKAQMANWNADFTGYPKSITEGQIFGSDKAFKYPIKKMWQNEGEKVLYIKSYTKESDKIRPCELAERYEVVFKEKITEKTDSSIVLGNLFSAIDVMNFGGTFAEKKNNISITGCVQVGQGFNKYKETISEVQVILSPFKNSAKENAKASSLGKKIVTDEAHYFYPFAVNPANYNDYNNIKMENFDGYTKEAYNKFKRGCLVAATALNTNSKSGCENEFAIFIELKEDSLLYLANLDNYIEFKKEDKNVIDFSKLAQLLKGKESEIDKIEVYYNKIDTKVVLGDLKVTENELF